MIENPAILNKIEQYTVQSHYMNAREKFVRIPMKKYRQ